MHSMASPPLAFVAFLLLLLFGAQISARGVASFNLVCLNATAPECQAPVNDDLKSLCCPSDRPICTVQTGHPGCYASETYLTMTARAAEETTNDGPSLIPWTGISIVMTSIPPIIITGGFTVPPSSSAEILSATDSIVEISPSIATPTSIPAGDLPTTTTKVPIVVTTVVTVTASVPIVTEFTTVTASVDFTSSTLGLHATVESSQQIFTQYPWPSFRSGPDVTQLVTAQSILPVFTGPWPTLSVGPGHTSSVHTGGSDNSMTTTIRGAAYPFSDFSTSQTAHVARQPVTSISVPGDDVVTVNAQNAGTTFPLALITDPAAAVPPTCQRYLTTTNASGTSTWLTYVARDCTGVSTDSTIAITSTTTFVAPSSTSVTSHSHCFQSSNALACESLFPPTTTISSTSTSTLFVPSTVAGVAAADSLTFSLVSSVATFSLVTSQATDSSSSHSDKPTTTSDACAGASTVYVTVEATPPTSTYTSWILQTTITGSASSSEVITVSSASDASSTAGGGNTSADAIGTSTSGSTATIASSSFTLTTKLPIPTTPFNPTNPTTPATPTTSGLPMYTGGADVVQADVSSGLLVMLTVAFVLLQ